MRGLGDGENGENERVNEKIGWREVKVEVELVL